MVAPRPPSGKRRRPRPRRRHPPPLLLAPQPRPHLARRRRGPRPRRDPTPTRSSAPANSVATSPAPRQLTLTDGTVVQLNTGGELIEQFTSAERRVLLARGEAHFAVTKNPARPFVVVRAGNLDVRAVGTAFNVHLQSAAVDVLVTEGIVQLKSSAEPTPAYAPVAREPIPLLSPGQRAVVSLAPVSPATSVVVTTATADEISRTLAWQAPLLRLGGHTLAELAGEFERTSGRRVVLADPDLATLRVGGVAPTILTALSVYWPRPLRSRRSVA